MVARPEENEYADYYRGYISCVPDGSLLDFLTRQLGDYREHFSGVTDAAAAVPPQPGKWSPKEVIGHVCDTERIMSYRALRFARGDAQELAGFEQDDYAREANSNARSLSDLLLEFESVRRASVGLFASLPPEIAMRTGVASGKNLTVRALAYIVAGHAQHHLELLKARSESSAARA